MKSKLTCNAANPAALPGPITCGSRTWRNDEDLEVLDELNAQLKAHGVRFAPDISTASRATTGGMISNNSCGARSVMYGKTIDHVLELDVVLSDGSPAHMRPLRRGATGPSAGSRASAQGEIAARYEDSEDSPH
jgi:hypothetical protein